ncbi:GlsB/YeaQ/YmgE family stress response membrane protein [Streptomyces corynorhini]|uniref:GlsB/YeaQ/YmgE family stress response membrane protein n=1 Tax=Streptomyces corynorhini TaxID=2282652 RepID=A0A370B2X1_9ACTN|nr:GlsB/YeaQ/YmgE family stress response membrane protein [Streptomyces corynorhini]RDG34719.1 GlsB/YeaQ/YmgE family stress response membrane protein [Streptomyces corynorhini]
MGIIAWIILGLLAGAIAKFLLPGKDPGGILLTMVLGVVGALLGGFLGKAIFNVDPMNGFFDVSTWIAAIAGSLIILIGYRLITGRRAA